MHPCPSCRSANLKKASLVYMEGTQNSVGVGVSNVGGGVGASKTVSKLAVLCAPPQIPDNFMNETGNALGLFFFVPLLPIGVVTGGISTFWIVWACLGLGVMFWKHHQYAKKRAAELQAAHDEWERKFICMTCGEFSRPLG